MCNYTLFYSINAKSIISHILMCSLPLQIESLLEVCLQRRNDYANGMQFKLHNSFTKLQAVTTRFKSITSMLMHPVWQQFVLLPFTYCVPLFLPLFSHRIIVAGTNQIQASSTTDSISDWCEFPWFFSSIVHTMK